MPTPRDHPSMDSYESELQMVKYRGKSRSALFMLTFFGCAILFFSMVLIGCAFTINYSKDFDVEGGGGIEEKVQSQFNYDQYWAGIPFLVTGILVLFSGVFQRSRGLTITTAIFCVASVSITLVVLSLDSGNFSHWNLARRRILYWEFKDGYTCGIVKTSSSAAKTQCVCRTTNASETKLTEDYSCKNIIRLSGLYGSVVTSAIVVTLFCMSSLIVITKSLSWKRIRYPQMPSSRRYYADDFYMESRPRLPSILELPQDKRGGQLAPEPAGSPYNKPLSRNYPYQY